MITMRAWVSRLGLFLGASLVVLLALVVLGAQVPAVPLIGVMGAGLVPLFAPWFIVVTAVAAAAWGWRCVRRRSHVSFVLTVVAVLAFTGSTTVLVSLVRCARSQGTSVDLGATFDLPSLSGSSLLDETATYGSFDGKRLDLGIYHPGGQLNDHGVPILLYVHGGGWAGQSKEQRGRDMRWFAAHGWLVVTVDYTLSSAQHHMWAETTSQVGCAMMWIAAHAGRYGGNPSRLSIVGDSAGGNLAINSAYMANLGTLGSSCSGTIPKVKAVSAVYPVVDAATYHDNPDPVLGGAGRLTAGWYTGGTPQQFPERYAVVRSSTYISAAAPPTLIMVGDSDHLVPPQATYDFVEQARSTGVYIQLIRVPYADHIFDLLVGSVGNQMFRQTTLRFRQEHG